MGAGGQRQPHFLPLLPRMPQVQMSGGEEQRATGKAFSEGWLAWWFAQRRTNWVLASHKRVTGSQTGNFNFTKSWLHKRAILWELCAWFYRSARLVQTCSWEYFKFLYDLLLGFVPKYPSLGVARNLSHDYNRSELSHRLEKLGTSVEQPSSERGLLWLPPAPCAVSTLLWKREINGKRERTSRSFWGKIRKIIKTGETVTAIG